MAAWHDEQIRTNEAITRGSRKWVTQRNQDRQRECDSLNLWHGIIEREPRKPGLSRKAWLGIAFGLYVSFMLGLFAWVLWKVAHPLPHLIP